jgi:hypothetical protein
MTMIFFIILFLIHRSLIDVKQNIILLLFSVPAHFVGLIQLTCENQATFAFLHHHNSSHHHTLADHNIDTNFVCAMMQLAKTRYHHNTRVFVLVVEFHLYVMSNDNTPSAGTRMETAGKCERLEQIVSP